MDVLSEVTKKLCRRTKTSAARISTVMAFSSARMRNTRKADCFLQCSVLTERVAETRLCKLAMSALLPHFLMKMILNLTLPNIRCHPKKLDIVKYWCQTYMVKTTMVSDHLLDKARVTNKIQNKIQIEL